MLLFNDCVQKEGHKQIATTFEAMLQILAEFWAHRCTNYVEWIFFFPSGGIKLFVSKIFFFAPCRANRPILPTVPWGTDSVPLPDFLNSTKTAADIDAKHSVPSSALIWRLPLKFHKIRRYFFWENSFLVTTFFAILGEKKRQMFDGC